MNFFGFYLFNEFFSSHISHPSGEVAQHLAFFQNFESSDFLCFLIDFDDDFGYVIYMTLRLHSSGYSKPH